MTRDESIKILAVLKTAYPNGYKLNTKEEADGMINLWYSQFEDFPYWLISLGIENCISSSNFPPTIYEVKDKIKTLYFQAENMLNYHHKALRIRENPDLDPFKIEITAQVLDAHKLNVVYEIIKICAPIYKNKQTNEKTLDELLSGYQGKLLHNKNLLDN